jgi:hypothetical protein
MKRRAALAFVVAAVLSGSIWALSPLLAGDAEPWDSDGPYYAAALVLAGAASGAAVPRSLWAHYLGAVAGQLGYELLFLPGGPLLLVGVLFLLVYSILFLAAAAFAAYLRVRVGRRAPGSPDEERSTR